MDSLKGFFTPVSTRPRGLEEVLDFHDSTKLKPETLHETSRRIFDYLNSSRGQIETVHARLDLPHLPGTGIPESGPASASSLSSLLQDRRSCRSFGGQMSLEQLSHILACFRGNGELPVDKDAQLKVTLRPYPSGGALYPVDLFVACLKVSGLEEGLYLFDPVAFRLTRLPGAADGGALALRLQPAFLCDEQLLSTVSLVLIFAASFERAVAKYGRRGYRLTLLEAGMMSYLASLAAVDQKLESLHYAGFFEDRLDRLLGLGPAQSTCHAVFLGPGAPS